MREVPKKVENCVERIAQVKGNAMAMEWVKLLDGGRRKYAKSTPAYSPKYDGARTEFERDHDRILFSTPFRRLIDKTQVFPLEKKYDTIRRRLTHSMEVGNLARSIGVDLAFNAASIFPAQVHAQRNIPALLAAIGMAHDLGNPPFGHQGESAIQSWFKRMESESRKKKQKFFRDIPKDAEQDFLRFEGNAQTIRLVTKLQYLDDEFGLDLTYGTLAAMLKYTLPAHRAKKSKEHPAQSKPGYFFSEAAVVGEIQQRVEMDERRHPLTYIMEACDDIAYSVLDAEDAAKKGLVSFADLNAWLEAREDGDPLIKKVREYALKKHIAYRKSSISPGELDDISMQMFRVGALAEMIPAVTSAFVQNEAAMRESAFEGDLMGASDARNLCKYLKEFDRAFAYRNKEVLGIELTGHHVITGLMDMLWEAISECESADNSRLHNNPFANYVFGRISENYRRVFEKDVHLPLRYRQFQLMTDMVSGMTDSYAVDLYKELKERRNGP